MSRRLYSNKRFLTKWIKHIEITSSSSFFKSLSRSSYHTVELVWNSYIPKLVCTSSSSSAIRFPYNNFSVQIHKQTDRQKPSRLVPDFSFGTLTHFHDASAVYSLFIRPYYISFRLAWLCRIEFVLVLFFISVCNLMCL